MCYWFDCDENINVNNSYNIEIDQEVYIALNHHHQSDREMSSSNEHSTQVCYNNI